MDIEFLYKRRYETIQEYIYIFKALEDMDYETPCKMGIHDGKLYRSCYFGQGIQRNYYGQSRNTFLDFLENTIMDIATIVNICKTGYAELDTDIMTKYKKMFLHLQCKIFLWMEKLDAISRLYEKDEVTILRFSNVLKLFYDSMVSLDSFNVIEQL